MKEGKGRRMGKEVEGTLRVAGRREEMRGNGKGGMWNQ